MAGKTPTIKELQYQVDVLEETVGELQYALGVLKEKIRELESEVDSLRLSQN